MDGQDGPTLHKIDGWREVVELATRHLFRRRVRARAGSDGLRSGGAAFVSSSSITSSVKLARNPNQQNYKTHIPNILSSLQSFKLLTS